MPIYLLVPVFAAIIYSLGSIAIKRALKEGVTLDQSFHLTNLALGLMFLPLIFFEQKEVIDWSQIWKPLTMGLTFFSGNWLTFIAIRRGDVSLVTPIMGTKVVFVAIAVVVLTHKMPSVALWIAAILTTIGIFVIGMADLKGGRHIVLTISLALGSAMIFGCCDVLVSWWSGGFGGPTFLVVASGSISFYSLILWLIQGRPALLPTEKARVWTGWGAFLVGLQAIFMGLCLTFYQDATRINVLYASRGLWVIVLLVVFGPILGNSEHRDSGRGFLWRVAGTVILTVAIVIAVADRGASS